MQNYAGEGDGGASAAGWFDRERVTTPSIRMKHYQRLVFSGAPPSSDGIAQIR